MSIGEALAEARRRAGLTVTQVSDKAGIRETIITGIEGDDYSACGGDLYVRGYIRSIAQAVGADPEPLIWEYDTAEPVTPVRAHRRLPLNWIAVLVLVWLGLAAYEVVANWALVTAAPTARAHPVAHRHAGHGTQPPPTPAPAPAPTPTTPSPGAVTPRTLTPASATAFGPYRGNPGDNGGLAHLAIDRNPATAWHTDWYTTARFGNLYPGTGLLVDMGRPVTITAAWMTLGRAPGARFQLRVGTAPTLAHLAPVAHTASAGGVVRLRLTTPAHGRYVLIWFTSLPPDPAGTFQASVYNLRLKGRP